MNDLRRAAELALEAMTASADLLGTMYLKMDAVAALRAALAEQPAPVAWMNAEGDFLRHHPESYGREDEAWTPLYTAQPCAEEASLTDEHVAAVVRITQPYLSTDCKAWRELTEQCRYWLEADRAVTTGADLVV